ncbi:MAG: carbohydrate ABC transporter permease [Anaerolineales bacterium]|nr:carbohydrate ABC transporter permease [Anaerolineales bacterium]
MSYKKRLVQRLRDGKTIFNIGGYIASIIYVLIIVVPLYYVIISAFKDNAQIFSAPLTPPSKLSLVNFINAEKTGRLGRALGISLFVTVCGEVLSLVLAFPAAYAIARIRTNLAALVERFFSLGFLIPAFAMLVPLVLLMAQLKLLYKPLSLVLLYPVWRLPLAIVVLAAYLRTVPRELEESAELDGASRMQILLLILFPLARAGVITVLIINFITFWNEYLFALILMSQENRTMQVALSILKGERSVDYGMLAAGVLFSIVPVYIAFLIFQERVVEGIYSGAVKG